MKHEWLLKRNCSLSPRQAGFAYGLLCLLMLLIGAAFLVRGLWIVLAFALLEIAAIAFALFKYARHATDHEHIALSEGCLLVERVEAGAAVQVRLDPCWTRIDLPSRERNLIRLESRGVKVEVGGFISEEKRQEVAKELRHELRRNSLLR